MSETGNSFEWLPATIVSSVAQTSRARSLTLSVPGLRPARAGQHVDLRLTADDGYTAVRSYSLSDMRGSRPSGGEPGSSPRHQGSSPRDQGGPEGGAGRAPQIEVTVEQMTDGEVSPYLVEAAEPGDPIEVRGPVGGWFVWPPTEFEPDSAVHAVLPEPSGSDPAEPGTRATDRRGLGHRTSDGDGAGTRPGRTPMRLLASVRDPESRWYVSELDEAVRASSADVDAGGTGLTVDWVYSRVAPDGLPRTAGRLTRDELAALVLPATEHPLVYVCGANSFVEAVAGWLVELGHAPTRVRTERFGGV